MNKGKKLFSNLTSIILILALIGLASGAIIQTYVTISGKSTINQAVVFANNDTSKAYDFGGDEINAGTMVQENFTLKSRAEDLDTRVELVTECDDNITVKYYKGDVGTEIIGNNRISMSPNSTQEIGVEIEFSPYLEGGDYTVRTKVEPCPQ
ncbi:MAG: hypothetical protein R6U44_08070 [Archaeoglobaceae archaeon]